MIGPREFRHVEINFKPTFNFLQSRILGFPGSSSGKESFCHRRRDGFNPGSGKIPHAVEQLSPCATTTKPMLRSPGASRAAATKARRPWSPCSTAREATAMRSRHPLTKTQHSQKFKKEKKGRIFFCQTNSCLKVQQKSRSEGHAGGFPGGSGVENPPSNT